MPNRRSYTHDDAVREVGDCISLFHIIDVVLSSQPGPLDGITRDALATVARLGHECASIAFDAVDRNKGGDRG